ncbi:MAG: tetratricopeptide repeat protein [Cyanobacteria bacterium SZAS LIN-3]|nr:tetratricopeptide repeat protein [Cyanobacteria bacterium SZAS LIN-3]MBS2006001.1 tetratricopeptide repeat protein [Cyanobacteria bacterium SZAS TMP-1]
MKAKFAAALTLAGLMSPTLAISPTLSATKATPSANARNTAPTSSIKTINSPADSAQIDHVRLLSSDQQLDERSELQALHKYILSVDDVVTAYFNNTRRGKAFGLSVNCDLLPGGKALYLFQAKPTDRLDRTNAKALSKALEKVKVPLVADQISLQILFKIWFAKNDASTIFKQGLAMLKADKNAEAIEFYTKAIAIDPDYAEAYTCRGIACNALGQYERAVTDLSRAIELDNKEAYLNRAFAYRHLNQPDKAMADCQRAIELDPKYWEGYVSRAELLRDRGDFGAAARDCDTALQLMPNCGYAYLVRGEVQYKQQQLDAALSDLNNAVEILARSGEAYHYRSLVKKGQGNEAGALEDEKRALELGYK